MPSSFAKRIFTNFASMLKNKSSWHSPTASLSFYHNGFLGNGFSILLGGSANIELGPLLRAKLFQSICGNRTFSLNKRLQLAWQTTAASDTVVRMAQEA